MPRRRFIVLGDIKDDRQADGQQYRNERPGVEVPVACNSLYVENSVDRASAMQAKHASPVP